MGIDQHRNSTRVDIGRRLLGFALAAVGVAGAQPSTAAAQDQRVRVEAGEGGRFVKLIDPKTRVTGHDPAAVQSFRQKMAGILAQLEAMPQVSKPPQGLCHQLDSWIELNGAIGAKVLGGEIAVRRPLGIESGRCIAKNNNIVAFGLNSMQNLVSQQHAMALDAEGVNGRHWYSVVYRTVSPGRIEVERDQMRVTAFTRADISPFRPVSARRYLEQKLREANALTDGLNAQRQANRVTNKEIERWRREERPRLVAELEATLKQMRGTLTPQQINEIRAANEEGLRIQEQILLQQLEQDKAPGAASAPVHPMVAKWRRQLQQLGSADIPACFGANSTLEELDLSGRCAAIRIIELNPNYFDAKRPGDIQLLTISMRLNSDTVTDRSRAAVWSALDLTRLQALVR